MARKFDSIDSNHHSKEFFFEGNNIGVLLIHGFTGSPGTMKKIGEELSKDGYTVSGIRLPGHGTHITDMEKSTWNEWLDAARQGALSMNAKCDKIIVCGLSMGGLLTLILAAELPINGAIPIAAAIEITDKMAPYARFFKYFVRYRGSGIQNDNDHPYIVNYACTPTRKVPDLLKLQKIAKMRLSEIKCPLLIIQGDLDETVPKSAAEMIYKGATSASEKEILYLENSYHVCTIEPEFDILIKELRKFIKKNTA